MDELEMPGMCIAAFALVFLAVVIAKVFSGGQFELVKGRPLFRPTHTECDSSLPSGAMKRQAPGWFLPAGVVSIVLAVLGFLASAATGGKGDLFFGLFAGALNPLFFVGLPLGIYWLWQHAKSAPSYSPSPPTSPEESNPKLTHCPDCGQHVSRLATTCPHCGRPLTPEKPVD